MSTGSVGKYGKDVIGAENVAREAALVESGALQYGADVIGSTGNNVIQPIVAEATEAAIVAHETAAREADEARIAAEKAAQADAAAEKKPAKHKHA